MARPRKGFRFKDMSRKDQETIREFARFLDNLQRKKKK